MRATNIHESEWEDFEYEMKRRKRNRDEFDFLEKVQPLIGAGVQPLRGTVRVRNRRTGAEREYITGYGSSWVADFARDLDSHSL